MKLINFAASQQYSTINAAVVVSRFPIPALPFLCFPVNDAVVVLPNTLVHSYQSDAVTILAYDVCITP